MAILVALPFVASALLYWLSCEDLLGDGARRPPQNWGFRLALPVLTGSLTVLPLIASQDHKRQTLLLIAVAAGIVFTIALGATLRDSRWFRIMRSEVMIGPSWLAKRLWWQVVRIIGLALILYSGVVTVLGG